MTQDHRQDWDGYWRGAGSAPVFSQFAADDAALRKFWTETLTVAWQTEHPMRFLDLACGSGAVTTLALEAAQAGPAISPICLDYAVSALDDLAGRLPMVRTVTASAAALPFADRQFDLVVSQFGLEYAGPDAFPEAARILDEGGAFTAICHHQDGAIHAECADTLETLTKLDTSGFLAHAKSAFSAAYAMDRGLGTTQAAETAARDLAQAAATVHTLVTDKGAETANGLPARLHRDVGHMFSRRRNFAPQDVFAWIDGMTDEVLRYRGRMHSMTQAALDADQLTTAAQAMTATGLTVEDPIPFRADASAPVSAWIVKARRPA